MEGTLVPLVLRLALPAVIFSHGAQKVMGWFGGGPGLRGTLDYFRKSGIPAPLALLAIAAEFLGPLGLAAGRLTRVAALGITVVMAIFRVHRQHGFFMTWFGNQGGEGFAWGNAS